MRPISIIPEFFLKVWGRETSELIREGMTNVSPVPDRYQNAPAKRGVGSDQPLAG